MIWVTFVKWAAVIMARSRSCCGGCGFGVRVAAGAARALQADMRGLATEEWRYSDRETIAEEHNWSPRGSLTVYRALRNAREDDKDQAGVVRSNGAWRPSVPGRDARPRMPGRLTAEPQVPSAPRRRSRPHRHRPARPCCAPLAGQFAGTGTHPEHRMCDWAGDRSPGRARRPRRRLRGWPVATSSSQARPAVRTTPPSTQPARSTRRLPSPAPRRRAYRRCGRRPTMLQSPRRPRQQAPRRRARRRPARCRRLRAR